MGLMISIEDRVEALERVVFEKGRDESCSAPADGSNFINGGKTMKPITHKGTRLDNGEPVYGEFVSDKITGQTCVLSEEEGGTYILMLSKYCHPVDSNSVEPMCCDSANHSNDNAQPPCG